MGQPVVRFLNTFEPVTTFYGDLIPYLVENELQIQVVMSRGQYRAGRDPMWMGTGVQVRWMPSLGVQPRGRLSKLVLMVAYIVCAAAHTLVGPRVDMNVFLTQPPLFVVWGYVLQRLRRQAYYQVLMDIYPDLAIEAGLLGKGSGVAGLLKRLSRFALRNANGVVVIGRCMEARALQMGLDPARIRFIPNWADQEAIVPVGREENSFRLKQGWQDKFVVLYSGNMGTSHYFDDILEVSRRMREQTGVVFVFVGSGQRRGEIEAYKRKHDLGNVVLLPFQRQEMLARSLSAGDLHFVSLRSGFEGLVVPSKTYGVLAAGRPILYQGPGDSEIAMMVEEERIGRVVPLHNAEELQQALLAYLRDPALGQRQGAAARQLAEGRYSRQAANERYAAVFGIQVAAAGGDLPYR